MSQCRSVTFDGWNPPVVDRSIQYLYCFKHSRSQLDLFYQHYFQTTTSRFAMGWIQWVLFKESLRSCYKPISFDVILDLILPLRGFGIEMLGISVLNNPYWQIWFHHSWLLRQPIFSCELWWRCLKRTKNAFCRFRCKCNMHRIHRSL